MTGGILKKSGIIEVIALLFDRLVDHNPRVQEEAIPFKTYTVPEVVESIARELDNLLNTRTSRIPYSMYASREELLDTDLSYRYGLPDFSQFDVADDRGADLLVRQIRRLVEHYEPRLSNIGVRILGSDVSKRLIVEISGVINVFPTPESFTFPVTLHGSGQG